MAHNHKNGGSNPSPATKTIFKDIDYKYDGQTYISEGSFKNVEIHLLQNPDCTGC